LDSLPKLFRRRLIDAAPGAGDQFCIEPAMIDAARSRKTGDQQPVEIPQILFLLME
jgi:hypothetical protein